MATKTASKKEEAAVAEAPKRVVTPYVKGENPIEDKIHDLVVAGGLSAQRTNAFLACCKFSKSEGTRS